MKLRLLFVGKDRSGLFDPAAKEYLQRIGRYARVEEVALRPSSRPDRAVDEEGVALLAKLDEGETLVALDERGRQLGSQEFARFLGNHLTSARPLAFAIGGDDGLSDAVRHRADLVLSLSRMTLPHRLARVLILEQIYRAFSILRGEPYHR